MNLRNRFLNPLRIKSMIRRFFLVSSQTLLLGLASAQETTLPPVVVTAARYPESSIAESAFSSVSLSRKEIREMPESRLDDLLRDSVPGFSLFRRSSSAVANPTTQGASLRNLGPNGAGRTLVLLDGIPQNDPFGGWVYWHRLPPELLQNVTVVRGGGAGLFGNNALGGTIYLTRHQPETFSASLEIGDRKTVEGTFAGGFATESVHASALFHGYTTDGYPTIREDQRGPVDIAAESTSYLFETGVSSTLDSGGEVTFRASYFQEDRGNGTPLTSNKTKGVDLSIGLRSAPGEFSWESNLFYQSRRFESQFSSVNEDRTAEVPALDQYRVPAQSVGFSFTGTFEGGLPFPGADREKSKLVTGIDGRWIEGETNERFRYVGDAFLNDREAGGQQLFVGAFAEQTWQATSALAIVLGGRADYWQVSDGRRVEKTIASGATLQDQRFPDRDGIVTSGRLAAVYTIVEGLDLKSSAYTGFRVPTLNELYRPFRVRNDITEANASLEPEKLQGIEAGIGWKPLETFHVSANVFYNKLNDAVANVTVLNGPGIAPDGTVVPDGGVYRQRRNVDSVSTYGVEIEGAWEITSWLKFSAGYQFSETEVSEPDSPALDGRQLAQAPAHVLTGALQFQPHPKWQATLQTRYSSPQFEDDLNSQELASYILWDASLTYRIHERLQVTFAMENLFDKTIETGKTADGIVSIGAPRLFSVRMKWEF